MAKRKRKPKTWKTSRVYDKTISTRDYLSEQEERYGTKNFQKTFDFWGDYDKSHQIKQAFTHGDLTFWGGPENKVTKSSCWDVIISLGERQDSLLTRIWSNKCNKEIVIITVPWNNNDSSELSLKDWQSLIAQLPQNGHVAVCCFGGTGRTGTALAILRTLLTGDTSDPVSFIRQNYKTDAIESDVQIRYIERITSVQSNCCGSLGRYGLYYPFDEHAYGWNDENSSFGESAPQTVNEEIRRRLLYGANARTY